MTAVNLTFTKKDTSTISVDLPAARVEEVTKKGLIERSRGLSPTSAETSVKETKVRDPRKIIRTYRILTIKSITITDKDKLEAMHDVSSDGDLTWDGCREYYVGAPKRRVPVCIRGMRFTEEAGTPDKYQVQIELLEAET